MLLVNSCVPKVLEVIYYEARQRLLKECPSFMRNINLYRTLKKLHNHLILYNPKALSYQTVKNIPYIQISITDAKILTAFGQWKCSRQNAKLNIC